VSVKREFDAKFVCFVCHRCQHAVGLLSLFNLIIKIWRTFCTLKIRNFKRNAREVIKFCILNIFKPINIHLWCVCQRKREIENVYGADGISLVGAKTIEFKKQ
jgi:hypothetical protein